MQQAPVMPSASRAAVSDLSIPPVSGLRRRRGRRSSTLATTSNGLPKRFPVRDLLFINEAMMSNNGYNPLGNPMLYRCDIRGCFNVEKRPKIEIFAECFRENIKSENIAMSDI